MLFACVACKNFATEKRFILSRFFCVLFINVTILYNIVCQGNGGELLYIAWWLKLKRRVLSVDSDNNAS